MAQPFYQSEHLDQILTNISVAYLQDPSRFIASSVFPIVPVDKQSDKYYIFDKNAFLRDQAQVRAPATESAGSGYTLSRDNYYCDVFALHKDISNQDRANADNPLNPDRNATQWLTQQMLLRQERQFVTDYIATSVWGTDMTGSATTADSTHFLQWSNYASSDPIGDVETGKETILGNTGFMPNTLVLGYQVFRQLRHHPDIVDLLKYTTDRVPTEGILAMLFGVDRVLVASSIYASNNEGETAAYTFTFGKNALLCYSAPAPGLEVASAGYIYAWTGVSEGLGLPVGVSRFYMPTIKSDRIEIERAWDNKVVGTDLGYFFSAATA